MAKDNSFIYSWPSMKKRKEDSPCQERQPKGCCTHCYASQQGEEEDYEKYGKGVT